MKNSIIIKYSMGKNGAEKTTHKSAQRNKDEKYERSIKVWKQKGEITTQTKYVVHRGGKEKNRKKTINEKIRENFPETLKVINIRKL